MLPVIGGLMGGSGLLGGLMGGGGLLGGLSGLSGINLGMQLLQGGPEGLVRNIMSTLAQNAISSLGLPAPITEMLQGMVEKHMGPGFGPDTSSGDMIDMLHDGLGLGLSEAATMVEGMEGSMEWLMKELVMGEVKQEAEKAKAAAKCGAGGGGSFIMQMAEKLGAIVDEAFEEMSAKLDALKGEEGGDDVKASTTMEAQGAVQHFSMIMNACTNMIKTVGQAAGQATSQ